MGGMGVKVVQQSVISDMGRAGRQVVNLIFNPPNKFMTGNIATEPLVKGVSPQQMGRGAGGGCRKNFCHHIVAILSFLERIVCSLTSEKLRHSRGAEHCLTS